MPHDPQRGELWFRFLFSLAGLTLVVVAVAVRGVPQGSTLAELIGIAALVLGASALWTGCKLFRLHAGDR